MRIDILGTGRLGRSLAVLWRRSGHDVRLRARGDLPAVDAEAVFLCVPDDVIPTVAADLPTHHTVLHCSGAADLAALAHFEEHGSLHPLMTFPGPDVSLPELRGVAAAIQGTPHALALARQLASDLEMTPVELTGDRRLYHAAAVVAGNFATVLIANASEVLQAAGIEPQDATRMVIPLAIASLRNATHGPAAALTGPFARGDVDTVQAHRDALANANLPDILALYDALALRATALAAQKRAAEHTDRAP